MDPLEQKKLDSIDSSQCVVSIHDHEIQIQDASVFPELAGQDQCPKNDDPPSLQSQIDPLGEPLDEDCHQHTAFVLYPEPLKHEGDESLDFLDCRYLALGLDLLLNEVENRKRVEWVSEERVFPSVWDLLFFEEEGLTESQSSLSGLPSVAFDDLVEQQSCNYSENL